MILRGLKILLLIVFVELSTGQEIPCKGDDAEACIIRDESIARPNNTVVDGEDMTFNLRATGNFTGDMTLAFPSTNDVEKKCLIKTENCWTYGYQLLIINDDYPGPREFNVTCNARQDGQFFELEIEFPKISQYESGEIELKNIQIEGLTEGITADHSYDVTVAIPPRNITLTGLERELEYEQDKENRVEISCTASYTRPAPIFHWSIENYPNYELMNYTVLPTQETPVVFDQAGYIFPGNGLRVTQPISLLIEPWFDGQEIKCTVEHLGYNSSFSQEDREVVAVMTVKGPPVPNDETFQAEGGFKIGEPATLLIPFHAYPQPESLRYQLSDLGGPLNVTRTENTTSAGRYTARGWRLKDESEMSRASTSSSREYYAILEISELEKEDRDRVHTLVAFNELGNATYTFRMQNIEDGGLSGGAIAGIVVGVLAGILLIGVVVILVIRHRNGKKSKKIKEERKRKKTAAREAQEANPGYNPGFQDVQLEVGHQEHSQQ